MVGTRLAGSPPLLQPSSLYSGSFSALLYCSASLVDIPFHLWSPLLSLHSFQFISLSLSFQVNIFIAISTSSDHIRSMLSNNPVATPRPRPPAKVRRTPSLNLPPPPPYAPRMDMILGSPITVTKQLMGAGSPPTGIPKMTPEVDEWMNEKSREELSDLLLKADGLIKSRETGSYNDPLPLYFMGAYCTMQPRKNLE